MMANKSQLNEVEGSIGFIAKKQKEGMPCTYVRYQTHSCACASIRVDRVDSDERERSVDTDVLSDDSSRMYCSTPAADSR
jgi:hypothetical protein